MEQLLDRIAEHLSTEPPAFLVTPWLWVLSGLMLGGGFLTDRRAHWEKRPRPGFYDFAFFAALFASGVASMAIRATFPNGGSILWPLLGFAPWRLASCCGFKQQGPGLQWRPLDATEPDRRRLGSVSVGAPSGLPGRGLVTQRVGRHLRLVATRRRRGLGGRLLPRPDPREEAINREGIAGLWRVHGSRAMADGAGPVVMADRTWPDRCAAWRSDAAQSGRPTRGRTEHLGAAGRREPAISRNGPSVTDAPRWKQER